MEQKSWVNLIHQKTYDFEEINEKIKPIFTKRNINVKDKSILLKPSFVFPLNNKEHLIPINTNNHVVLGVAKTLGELGAKKIFIAESETILVARYSFDMVEIKKDVKKLPKSIQKKIEFLYLDECYKEKTKINNPFIEGIEFDYPKIVKDVDMFISLPKLKANLFSKITLSVKNNMGLIPRDNRLAHHGTDLHELIADIWQVRPPDYIITDAIYAGEGQGPQMAQKYPTNLLIFGNNGMAVDSISCELMNHDPNKIRHLKLLSENGYGTLKLDEIEIINKNLIAQQKHNFIRPEKDLEGIAPNIHVYKGELCESGCEPFVRGILEAWGLVKGWENMGEVNIIYGKNVEVPEEDLKHMKKRNTIVYGDCAKKYKKYGYYYYGCPPDYLFAGGWFILRYNFGFPKWVHESSIFKLIKDLILSYGRRIFGKKYKKLD